MDYLYGALLLHKLGKEVNEENMKKIISATGAEVDEAKIKTLIASLKDVDIAAELENASAVAAVPSAGAGGADAGKEKKEEKKEEEKPSESAAGLSSLFG